MDGPDGLVHLLYMGEHIENHTNYLAAAVSSDGIPQMEIEAERHRHFGRGFARPGF